jgi:intracellular sulfur oxidation DsrE/DsrF family protein
MKTKIISFVLAMLIVSSASAQYFYFRTDITCTADKKEFLAEANEKINEVLNQLVKEDIVFGYETEKTVKEDKLHYTYYFPLENQKKFEALSDLWTTRFTASYPEVSSAFWETCPRRRDTLMNKSRVFFPVIKDLGAPVVEVAGIDEKLDPKMNYNIVIDFTYFPKLEGADYKQDSSVRNDDIVSIGRIFNLHVADGVPKEKVNIVLAIHAIGMLSFLTNEAYQRKYNIDNPNVQIIEKLNKAGVKFLVCGQSLTWMGYKKTDLLPGVKVAISAQTVLSHYQSKGYAWKRMGND